MERPLKPLLATALLAVVALAAPSTCGAQEASWGPVALGLAGSIVARNAERSIPSAAESTPALSRALVASSTISAGGLAGLVDGSIEARMPIDSTRRLAATIGGVSYGSYRLFTLGAAMSMPLTAAIKSTVGMRIESQSIDGYGVAAAILFDAGATVRLSPALSLGAAARNVTGSRLRGIPRAQSVALGTLLALEDSADVSFDIEHVAGRGIVAACGGSLAVAPGLVVRGGARLDGSIVSAGFGFDDGGMFVDVALAWIDALGAQCAAGVGMRW